MENIKKKEWVAPKVTTFGTVTDITLANANGSMFHQRPHPNHQHGCTCQACMDYSFSRCHS